MTEGSARLPWFVLPGWRAIRSGRTASGSVALLSWSLGWTTVLVGGGRLVDVGAYGAAEWLALVTLLVMLAAPLAWEAIEARDLHSGQSGSQAGKGRGPWIEAGAVFNDNRLAVLGLVLVVAVCLLALLAPFVAPFEPGTQGDLLVDRLQPPSSVHPFGTDQLGRDVLSRVLYGARISLSVGALAVAISLIVGVSLGATAGYLGGVPDSIVMRTVDVFNAFPRLVLLISVVAIFEPSLPLIVAVLALTLWPAVARIVRGEVLGLRSRDFVQAAEALGFPPTRVVVRHILPNALAPIIVTATLGIGNVIVLEAGLSFLGFGVRAPTPSWGGMVADGRGVLIDAWWLSSFSGLAIVLTVFAFNVLGDGLRDVLDPRMRQR